MLRKNYKLLLFVILLIISIPFESLFVIQNTGWNTIIPATDFLEILVFFLILIIVLIYLRIKNRTTAFQLFVFHFICCIPLVLYARFNHLLRHLYSNYTNDPTELSHYLGIVAYTSILLFLIGQIFFILLLKSRKP